MSRVRSTLAGLHMRILPHAARLAVTTSAGQRLIPDGLHSYGLYSYGLYSHGLYSQRLYSYGIYGYISWDG